jgi:hypothetical protein
MLDTAQIRSRDQLLAAAAKALRALSRGDLTQLPVENATLPTQLPLDGLEAAAKIPDIVQYRFKCKCGELFEILVDTYQGHGAWSTVDQDTP